MAWSGVLEAKAVALAANQHGVVSRDQLVALGISRRTISRRVKAKLWKAMYPGVVRLFAVANRWHQELSAVLLWLGDDAAVSHGAAARLWEMDGADDEPVEVSTTRVRNGKAPVGITLHRVSELPRGDVTVKEGLRVTSVSRTLADLARTCSRDALDAAIDSVLRTKRTSRKQLTGYVASRTFRNVRVFRALMDERADSGPKDSEAERLFVRRVIEPYGLPRPVHNHRIYDDQGRFVAKVDFFWPQLGVVVEIFSRKHHSGDRKNEHDSRRTNRLTGCGLSPLIFWWNDVTRNAATTAEQLGNTLARRQMELGVTL